ncbi:hypothetical protein OAK38_06200 [Verrucomicrobia bacterium]|nr:hypothetical protein [Verrucomicrobiota bacterium]
MTKHSTDSHKESPDERNERVDLMLQSMVIETALWSLSNKETPPSFTREQIADYVGTSKDDIRRIEENALRKLKDKLSQ